MNSMNTKDSLQPVIWQWWQRYLFRFWSIYFIVYFYSLPTLNIVWEPVVLWFGKTLGFAITDAEPNGSGDTLFNYVQVLCVMGISAIVCIAWSLISKRRQHLVLLSVTLTLVRYALVFYMISYGMAKITLMQFPSPSLIRLLQPYGESSPMGLAWTFIGASPAFSIFTGWVELTGGLLLFFRRTALFGALFSLTVITNIVAMNLCYDIPVKLFSLHLLLACIFIITPSIKRIWNFFFSGKTLLPQPDAAVFLRYRYIQAGLKILVAAVLLYMITDYFPVNNSDDKPILYGIYNTSIFIQNGDTLAPLATDSIRWQYVIFDKWERAAIKKMNLQVQKYNVNIDSKKKSLEFTANDKSFVLQYQVPDSGHLIISGKVGGDNIHAILSKKDTKDFLLINRGFHWINETPFNK